MRSIVAAFVAALLLAAAPAFADVEAKAGLGFAGRWIQDAAAPVRLTLSNTGGESLAVMVSLSQSEGMATEDVVHRRVVRLAAGSTREEIFLVAGPRPWSGALHVRLEVDPVVPIHSSTGSGDRGSLTFEVEAGGQYSSDRIDYATHVVGVVGDPSGRIASRLRALGLSADESNAKRLFERVEAIGVSSDLLRLAPLGLDGLDALLVCDPDSQFCADPAVLDGVLDWVALGGTLVVSLGEHAGQFAASPLARETPASWSGAGRRGYSDRLAPLGGADASEDFEGPWTELRPGPLAVVAKSDPANGRADVERRLGLGRIVVLAYDLRTALAAPWLDEKRARDLLVPTVTLEPTPDPPRNADDDLHLDVSGEIARVMRSGAFDPPPPALVVLGIILYVVVVGPLDWFILKRLKKERYTTLTFLGAVTAFTLLAYGASLLLFSTGARVNRIVFADLVDAGRDGRQLLRFVDIAGYYSPTGADQRVTYAGPAVLLRSELPGFGGTGDVGALMPVQVASPDALHPLATVQLAFRSQRVVRATSVATTGPTIEVEWDGAAGHRGVRVVNGLGVALDDVLVCTNAGAAYHLGAVPAGGTSRAGEFERTVGTTEGYDDEFDRFRVRDEPAAPTRESVGRMLEVLTLGASRRASSGEGVLRGEPAAALSKLGILRRSAFDRGHALVIARASKFGAALPGADVAGDTYVVLRKEVEIR